MQKRFLVIAIGCLLISTVSLRAEPARVQVEHKSPVTCMAWAPGGRQIATGTQDGTVRIIEAANGNTIRSFATGHAVVALAFAPDGKSIAESHAGGVNTWEIATGQQQSVLMASFAPDRLAYLPDGRSIVGNNAGETLHWRLTGALNLTKAKTTTGLFDTLAPDGVASASCDTKGNLRVYQFDPVRATVLQVGNATCIGMSTGGKLLAVGSEDKSVSLWDLPGKKKTAVLNGMEKVPTKVMFSANSRVLAALGADGSTIHIWDLTRKTTRRQVAHKRGVVGALALSPDGTVLATAGLDDKFLLLWNVSSRELAHQGPPAELAATELASLWDDLAETDHQKADAAWHKLGSAGDHALPFLRQQIRPIAVPTADIAKIEKLVADLDAEKFATRERATKELLASGELAIVPLQRTLEKQPSGEAATRAKLVLNKLGVPPLTPERERVLQAIELLEQVGTAKAIDLLEEIKRDALVVQIRAEAVKALERMSGAGRNKD